jgi:hypothetical protein
MPVVKDAVMRIGADLQSMEKGRNGKGNEEKGSNSISFKEIVRSVILPVALGTALLFTQDRAYAQAQNPEGDAELQGPSAKEYFTHIAVKYLNPQLKFQEMSLELKAVPVTNVLWVGYELNCLLDNQMWAQTGLIYFGGNYYLLNQLMVEDKPLYAPNGDVGREPTVGGTINEGDSIKIGLDVDKGKVHFRLEDLSNPKVKAEKEFDVGSATACVGKQNSVWGTYTGIAVETVSYTLSITTPGLPELNMQEFKNTSEILPSKDDLVLGAKYFIPRTGERVFMSDQIPKKPVNNKIGPFKVDVSPELIRIYRESPGS